MFHWLVADRVEYLETTPAGSRLQHIRIVAFMIVLLVGFALVTVTHPPCDSCYPRTAANHARLYAFPDFPAAL